MPSTHKISYPLVSLHLGMHLLFPNTYSTPQVNYEYDCSMALRWCGVQL